MNPEQALSKSIHNLASVQQAKMCGCYHCCKLFEPQQVVRWTDDNDTALCPLCGIDAVVPDVTEADLKALHGFLFA